MQKNTTRRSLGILFSQLLKWVEVASTYYQTMRLLFFSLMLGFYACGQQPEHKKHIIDPKAKALNDSAISAAMQGNYQNATDFLDQATKIDSNFYMAFANKLSFQLALKQFDHALLTAKNLIRIKPLSPDPYVTEGLIYEVKGDTISSHKYFIDAENCYNRLLDTMSKTNRSYNSLLLNKATNLILVGVPDKGNDILRELSTNNTDSAIKEFAGEFMNKSKKEIIEMLISGGNSTDEKTITVKGN